MCVVEIFLMLWVMIVEEMVFGVCELIGCMLWCGEFEVVMWVMVVVGCCFVCMCLLDVFEW